MPTFNQEFEGFSSLNHENIVVEGFKSLKESEGTAPEFVVDALTARLSSKISNADSQQLESLLEIGVSCLLCFVQAGWTGPDLSFTSGQLLSANVCLKRLVVDEEVPYSLTPQSLLLLVAKCILVDHLDAFNRFQTASWWTYRCAFMHQKILDNFSHSLQSIIFLSLDSLKLIIPAFQENDRDARLLHARFHLERGLVHHYYTNDSKSKQQFALAQECSRLEWNLTGALGKRTKFQIFDVSQLVVMAKSHVDSVEPSTQIEDEVPEIQDLNNSTLKTMNQNLNDDTLLEKISFTNPQESENVQSNLSVIDQCILLAFCLNIKNTNPHHGLTIEEMSPYISRVLENPNNWMVFSMALLLRSRLEVAKSRKVERACLQMQALVNQFETLDAPVPERLLYFFTIELPSKWEIEKELGRMFVSIGVIRSALEIFERLEMWEDVISCHQMLEQPKKNPTAILYCLLGDVKTDSSLYTKAWEFSNGRCARAMRSLGADHFRKNEWRLCIDSYANALAINPLFDNSWFVMGCAALKIEDYDSAITAFSRVTAIDSENAEAWNNLASVYIKQKKLAEAFRCLKEAVRPSYDSSNIWENFLCVAVDLGEFQESLRAFERIFTIRIEKDEQKARAVDFEILEICVMAVVKGVKDVNGNATSTLAPKMKHLLELFMSRITSAQLYTISAKFYTFMNQNRLSLDYAQKAYRTVLNNPYITEKELSFKQLVHVTLGLVDAYSVLGPMVEEVRMGGSQEMICKDWSYQAQMAIKAVIRRTKVTYEGHLDFESLLNKLNELKNQ